MNSGITRICIAFLLLITAGVQVNAARPALEGVDHDAQVSSRSTSMTLPAQVIVYYFHGNARCPSCYKIEQYAREGVEQNFEEEIRTGKIVFTRINVEQSGNDHFVEDYQLYTKAVVISMVRGGKEVKYKNLEKVWDLIRDQERFHDYVRGEVMSFLGEL